MIENTQRKLREAQFFHAHLIRESERTVRNEPESFGFYLSAFLSAARSVTLVLQKEEKQKYESWFHSWAASLAPEEVEILKFMNEQRVAEVHLTGAETVISLAFVPIRKLRQDDGHPAYGLHDFSAPWTEPAKVGVPVSHFTMGGTPAKVVEVSTQYLRLLERLVHDFIKAHS